MHAAWLMLRWNGSLGGAESVVEFVQGDGGLVERVAEAGKLPNPLRTVPIDVLSQFIGRRGLHGPQTTPGPDEPGVPFEELVGPPFDDLRQRIDHAAMLGLPILLQGERGTGKTFLAHYYHRRRQLYRDLQVEPSGQGRKTGRDAKETPRRNGERFPVKTGEGSFVGVTLSEFADLDTLRDTLFGWAKGSWTGAEKGFDGLLGEAHGGTLFLDEVHHLSRPLQAALLAPLNNRRYRPKMSTDEVVSHFDLVVATNEPEWRSKMADDFRDRIERIVLEVPPFRSFQRHGADNLWRFWNFTLRRRCRECGIEYNQDGPAYQECREELLGLFRRHPLPGNWRDFQRLADNLLLHLTAPREGRPSPLRWDRDKLEHPWRNEFRLAARTATRNRRGSAPRISAVVWRSWMPRARRRCSQVRWPPPPTWDTTTRTTAIPGSPKTATQARRLQSRAPRTILNRTNFRPSGEVR
jgi:DNA-binding NtrC family response regulator